MREIRDVWGWTMCKCWGNYISFLCVDSSSRSRFCLQHIVVELSVWRWIKCLNFKHCQPLNGLEKNNSCNVNLWTKMHSKMWVCIQLLLIISPNIHFTDKNKSSMKKKLCFNWQDVCIYSLTTTKWRLVETCYKLAHYLGNQQQVWEMSSTRTEKDKSLWFSEVTCLWEINESTSFISLMQDQ